MKKIITLICGLTALCAYAEGYQVNTLSARQGGMAHTGVAQRLGAESMYFNPAALAFMDQTIGLQGSFNAVMSTAKATIGGKTYETDNTPSTPLMANGAFSIYDNLKAGISFYTPYGSGINWGHSWPGAILNQSVSLKAYTLQPTVAWKITPHLSVGAGLSIAWGNVDLSKGLINPSTMDVLINVMKASQMLPEQTPLFQGSMPASVSLKGNSAVALGYNVGILWDPVPSLTLGAQFRSKTTLKVKAGTASVAYLNSLAQSLLESELGMIDEAEFKAEMPLPYVLTLGAAWRPAEAWLVAFDAQLTGWGAYKELNISFPDPNVSKFDQHLVKDYKNSWAFRLGAQYSVTPRLDVRAGLILDQSPVNKDYYNPETPGMMKIEPCVGFSFSPIRNLAVDFSFLYVAGLGADNARCPVPDMLAAKVNAFLPESSRLPLAPTFEANYKVHAFCPSIGVSYGF